MKKSILFGIWLFVSCLTACTDKTESGGSGGSSGGSSGYEGRPLPVVFHVLYEDATDAQQNPAQSVFVRHINRLNAFYAATLFGGGASVAVDVSFKLAATDPQGNKMAEPGIHRVSYAGAGSMDPVAFMDSKHPEGSANILGSEPIRQYMGVRLQIFAGRSRCGRYGDRNHAFAVRRFPLSAGRVGTR